MGGNGKTIPSISIEAQTLIRRLRTMEVGETIAYGELSTLIGRDVQKERGTLYTAMNRLREDECMMFGCVRAKGIKRLSDEEIVDSGEYSMDRIRREARRGIKKLDAVVAFDELPEEKRVRHNMVKTILYMNEKVTAKKVQKQLEEAVTAQSAALPLVKALEAFQEAMK